ncbi:hypothetical protein Bbelb_199080 [Branchiostoma belcheri]|nr:hypothetical protein Bbelb_199080 [Branchiostoma belcheri]
MCSAVGSLRKNPSDNGGKTTSSVSPRFVGLKIAADSAVGESYRGMSHRFLGTRRAELRWIKEMSSRRRDLTPKGDESDDISALLLRFYGSPEEPLTLDSVYGGPEGPVRPYRDTVIVRYRGSDTTTTNITAKETHEKSTQSAPRKGAI